MTTLIFVRHGESLGNARSEFLGHTDLDLSEKGYAQAECAGRYIQKNFKPDIIYSSDLLRAYNTAETINKYLQVEIIKDKSLREIYAGEWEGKTFDRLETEFQKDFSVWRNDIGNAICTGGESVAELQKRVLAKVNEIVADNDGKTVLTATHATVIRALECAFRGVSLSEMKNIPWVKNASVSMVEYSGGQPNIRFFGNSSFMGDLATKLPANV